MTKVRLPVVSGAEAVKVFEKAGWNLERTHEGRGSHIYYMGKPGVRVKLSIPKHSTLDTGLLKRFIRDAGMTNEEFATLAAK